MPQSDSQAFHETQRLRILIVESDDVDFDRCVHHLNKAKLDACADRIRSSGQYESQMAAFEL